MSPLLNAIGEWAEQLSSAKATEFASLKGASALPVSFLEKKKITFINRNTDEFQLEYRLGKLFSKWEGRVDGKAPDARAAAISKWLADNARLAEWDRRLMTDPSPEFHDFHEGIQRRISDLCSKFSLSAVAKYFRHGPGRTSTRAGVKATKVQKYVGPFSISSRMYRYLLSELNESDDWWLYHVIRSDQISISDTLVMDTVPKTAVIDRVVTYEADLDMYVQLGFHSWMVNHILPTLDIYIDSSSVPVEIYGPHEGSGSPTTVRKHGVSSELHKEYVFDYDNNASLDAESGSNNWSAVYIQYYTMGLSSLSRFLGACEVQHVELPAPYSARVRKLIHAGMGNGVAFALETLLFYLAMEQAIGQDAWISVYGDDMMCKKHHAQTVVDILTCFTPIRFNADKSHYLQGDNFVESCGEDTYNGFSVWPLRLKDDPTMHFKFTVAQLAALNVKPKNVHQLDAIFAKLQKSQHKLKHKQLEAIYDFYTIINGVDRMSSWYLSHDPLWEDLSRKLLSTLPYCLRFLYAASGNGGRRRKHRFTLPQDNYLEGWRGVCISLHTREDTFSHKEDSSSTSIHIGTKRGRKTVDVDGDSLLAYALGGNPSRSATRLSSSFFRIGLPD